MKHFILFLFLGLFVAHSQSNSYTKKGYAAAGYDVVSYFENKAEEGNPLYSIVYKDVKYKFSTKSHLEKFKKNQESYIPQYGGYCAYAVSEKSKKVSINPETFEVRDGKLYLFYNSWGTNTLELWLENNVESQIKQADKNWLSLTNKK